jgi:transcriptional regulator GlxA family with amidase domain
LHNGAIQPLAGCRILRHRQDMTHPDAPARHIGILLFDQVEELDAIGPWEVFAYWTRTFPGDGYAVTTFSADGRPVTCAASLVVQPHHSFATVPLLGVLVHPGGDTDPLLEDSAHLRWLREQRARVPLMTSVCTGSTVFAAAGLLYGRPATSHHNAIHQLRQLDPTITPQPGQRYIDDGDIITAAGISAGIDMAFHIISRLASPDRARQIRAGIEYAPQPDY